MRSNGAVAVRAMTPASPPAAAMREPSSTWIRRETGAGGSSADQAAVRSLPEQTACALRQCACHILHSNALRERRAVPAWPCQERTDVAHFMQRCWVQQKLIIVRGEGRGLQRRRRQLSRLRAQTIAV